MACIFSSKVQLPTFFNLLLPLLPIIMFWVIEAMHAAHMYVMEIRTKELEKILGLRSEDFEIPNEYTYYSGTHYETITMKIKTLLYAFFRMETVFVFYLFLILITIVLNFIAKDVYKPLAQANS